MVMYSSKPDINGSDTFPELVFQTKGPFAQPDQIGRARCISLNASASTVVG